MHTQDNDLIPVEDAAARLGMEPKRLRGLLDRVLTQVRKTLTQDLSDEIEAALATDRDSATPPTP